MTEGEPATKRRAVFRVAAVAVALLIAVGVAEIAARLLVPDDAVFDRIDRWETHPRLGRVLRPDHSFTVRGVEYRVNAMRLRDRPFPPQSPQGVKRIAVVGDSFVYGIGPQETIFPKVLERSLGDTHPGEYEVMSVGMPGYGTVQQNDFLDEYLADYRFDLVILAFCVGNDITENRRSMGWEADPSRRERRERGGAWEAVKQNSALYGVWRGLRKRSGGEGERKFHEFVADRMRLACPQIYETEHWRDAYDRTLVEIDRMRRFAAERGAEFAVLLLPDEYQLDAALRAENHRRHGTEEKDLEPDLVQRRITQSLGKSGIVVIDPLDAFRRGYEPGRYFIPFDTHYDEAGNALVAAALLDFLNRERSAK